MTIKIRIQLLLPLVLIQLFAHAQKFSASVSPVFKAEQNDKVFKWGSDIVMAEETDNKLQFALSFKLSKVKYGIKLYRYNEASKLVKENHLFNGERKFGPFPSTLEVIGDVPYLIYPQYVEGENNIKILASEIEPKELTIKEPKELLQLEIQNIGIFKVGELLSKGKLSLKLSPDKTRLLCFWSSGLNNEYYISVLDPELKPIWNKKETALPAKKIQVDATTIDNNGNVYLSYKPDADKEEFTCRLAICQAGKKAKDMEIKLPTGRRPYQALVVASKTGMVHIGGTYAGATENLAGVFYQTVSSDSKLSKAQTTDFSEEQVKHLDKVDQGGWGHTKAKKYGLMPFKMRGYELEDGSLSLVGEFRGYRKEYKNKAFYGYVLSGSLIHAGFTNGQATIGYIPKYRESAGGTIGDSYYAFPYKNKLLVFYNDYEENLKLGLYDKFEDSDNYRKSVLVAAVVNTDGTVKREKVLDLTEEHFLPVGDAAIPLTNSSLLIPAKKIKRLGGVDEESKWAEIKID